MRVNYRPGTWNALIREQALLVLPASSDAGLIADAWSGFDGIRELGAIVDLLTARSGGSLASLPDFAAVILGDGDARVAVRGAIEVVVDTADGPVRISGAEVSTWSERLLRGATRVELVTGDGEAQDAAELPIVGGVVRAARIVLDPAGAPAAARVENAAAGFAPTSAPQADRTVAAVSVDAAPGIPVVVPAPVPAPVPLTMQDAPVPVSDVSAADAPEADEPNLDDTILPEPEPEPEPDLTDTILPEDVASTDEIDEFDLLFGQTIHRPAADAPEAVADPALAGDHDGATISSAEARALRRDAPVSPEAPTIALPVVGGTGRIRVSTGQVVTLDRTVIIGRRPRSTRASGANLPHLIAVESPQQDISRSHLEVRPEGDTVVVIDLHTTNGSTLLRSGADPVRLHPGEQTIVLSGDVVDLGDGVTVAFEDLP